MENKLSFFKRIALTKSELFTNIQSEDLDKAGNNRSGYYSIKTIMLHLNPIMTKYDLDFDIIISDKLARFIWIDTETEKTREITLELKPMSEIERLASMQNIVQSGGAVLSYYKRYLLTTALNLNSTDLIENSPSNQNQGKNQNNKNQSGKQGQTTQPEKTDKTPVLASEKQLKAMFALMGQKGVSKGKMKEEFKKQYNIDSSSQLNTIQYNNVMTYLKGLKDKPKEAKKEETTTQ